MSWAGTAPTGSWAFAARTEQGVVGAKATCRGVPREGIPACGHSGLISKNDPTRQHGQHCRTHRRGAESMTESEFSQLLQDLVLKAESGNLPRPEVIDALQGILDALKNAAGA